MGPFWLLTVDLCKLYAKAQTDDDPWQQSTCNVISIITYTHWQNALFIHNDGKQNRTMIVQIHCISLILWLSEHLTFPKA